MTTNNSIDSINGVKVAGIHTVNSQSSVTPTTWNLPINALTTSTLMNSKITNVEPGSNLIAVDVDISSVGLAAAGQIIVLTASTGARYRVRSMMVNFPPTAFITGDRDIVFKETAGHIWSQMPAASILTLDNAGWGSVTLPFPAGGSAANARTVISSNIFAQYSGGTTDYADGVFQLTVVYEKVV